MTTIAILGHQAHGKTTLAQAIAGTGAAFQIVDGALAPNLDAVVVVVSAPDGPMPGTRDALQHGATVPKLVMFLNKCDMIGKGDDELLDLVELELRDLASKHGRDGDALVIVRGSARDATSGGAAAHHGKRAHGVDALVAALS